MFPSSISFLFFFALYTTYWLPTTLLYWLRRQYEPIKSRELNSTMIQALYTQVYFTILCIQNAGFFSCVASYFVIGFLPVLWFYPYFLRALQLWASYVWNFQRMKLSIQAKKQQSHLSVFPGGSTEDTSPTNPVKSPLSGADDPAKTISLLGKYSWVARKRYQMMAFLAWEVLLIVITLVVFFSVDWPAMRLAGAEDEGADCPYTLVFLAGAEVGFGLILMAICSFGLWRVQDNLWIKSELKYSFYIGFPLFAIWLILILFNANSGIALIFVLLGLFCSHVVFITIPLIISYNWERKYKTVHLTRAKHESPLTEMEDNQEAEKSFITGKKRDLIDIVIENDILLSSFEKFCAKSFCVESILFLKSVHKYVKEYDPIKAPRMAREMEIEYLSKNSNTEINLDDIILKGVVEAIHEENITKDLFFKASRSVHDFLKYGPFEMWRHSSGCSKALAEAGITSLNDLLAA